MMKTARFSNLVEMAGNPDFHLLLSSPKNDKALQKAIRENRVVTIFQTVVGNKTDHGEAGFIPGSERQYLMFPKSVSRFNGKRIVGINYDLLESASVPKRERATRPAPPKQKREKVPPSPKPERRRESVPEPTESKVVPFTPESSTREEDGNGATKEAVAKIKRQLRRVMSELEKGKQVAAFNLLKKIVDG